MVVNNIKIVAIDDNIDNLITLKALVLEAFPEAEIYTALTGLLGIEYVKRMDPDLVLLDVIMPEMDGFEVCTHLKQDKGCSEIPVVFVTATKGDKEKRIKALELGADGFLAKPIDQPELIATIRAMVKIKASVIAKRDEEKRLNNLVRQKTSDLEKEHTKILQLLDALRLETSLKQTIFDELNENRTLLNSIINGTTDVIFAKNTLGKYLLLNNAAEKALGENANDIIGKDDTYLSTNEEALEIMARDHQVFKDNKTITYEETLNYQNEKKIYLSTKGPLLDKNNQGYGIFVIARDISERKKFEEDILYLSYHDQLTGLYNRRFFEVELARIDQPRNLPLTIVMGDVNGLKLINDSFGHSIGDQLLINIATSIRKACRADDIISRVGGDEFMLILPNTNTVEAIKVINRIKLNLAEVKVNNFELSVSFGYETKTNSDQDIAMLLKKTEDFLYQHKLYESASSRSKTIELIMKTLFEKNKREMLHSTRVSHICELIAKKMELPKEDVNQIRITGLMHDIGKIGIDESILNSEKTLSAEEWIEIRKHPEIGYRILSSSTEFSEVSEDVLQHHERWDGKGYPRGLKGEEISVKARIIAIADAYDAMTSDRAYRKALSIEYAIKEIEKYSGKHFDPFIVKIFLGIVNEVEV